MIAKRTREVFSGRDDVVAVYLFGSHATGTATSASDVDVGVLYTHMLPASLSSAAHGDRAELEAAFGAPVDLIELRACSVDLAHRIITTGQVLLDAQPKERLRFEVDARNRYFDLKPILDRYRRVRAS